MATDDLVPMLEELERRIRDARLRLIEGDVGEGMQTPWGKMVARQAEAVLEGRRRMARRVPEVVVAGPAFDMLLDLYIAAERGEAVGLAAMVAASLAPPEAARRAADLLIETGLVERQENAREPQRPLLRLSPAGDASMRDCLADLARILPWREATGGDR